MSVKEIAENCAPTDKLMTTKELAKQLGTKPAIITENAKKCLPNKKIQNGKPTYWSEAEVTILLEFMKKNNNRTDLDLSNRTIGANTSLTPALQAQSFISKLNASDKNTQRVIISTVAQLNSMLVEALQNENNMLTDENKILKHQVEYNEVIGCARWTDVKKLLNIKVKWDIICTALSLEENVDYYKKCMGYDNYPTVLLPDNTVNRIKECISSIEQENRK